jgi:hypothetical protein
MRLDEMPDDGQAEAEPFARRLAGGGGFLPEAVEHVRQEVGIDSLSSVGDCRPDHRCRLVDAQVDTAA